MSKSGVAQIGSPRALHTLPFLAAVALFSFVVFINDSWPSCSSVNSPSVRNARKCTMKLNFVSSFVENPPPVNSICYDIKDRRRRLLTPSPALAPGTAVTLATVTVLPGWCGNAEPRTGFNCDARMYDCKVSLSDFYRFSAWFAKKCLVFPFGFLLIPLSFPSLQRILSLFVPVLFAGMVSNNDDAWMTEIQLPEILISPIRF